MDIPLQKAKFNSGEIDQDQKIYWYAWDDEFNPSIYVIFKNVLN